MSDETDTRDRVIRMEVELDQVKKDIKEVKDNVSDVKDAVDDIKSILTQAQGVRKVFQIMIWLSGTSLFIWGATYSKAFMLMLFGK
jgi:hypothetical protein